MMGQAGWPKAGIVWEGVSVPEGWEAIGSACHKVFEGLADFCQRCSQTIMTEIEEYSALRVSDYATFMNEFVGAALIGMAERRRPQEHEKRTAIELGRVRAGVGGTSDAIVRSYQVAYRELWAEISSTAQVTDRDTLLEAISNLWLWLNEMSEAAAASYRSETSAQDARVAHLRERFLDALRRGDTSRRGTLELGRSLGFDAAGSFQVVWLRGVVDTERLRLALADVGGVAHAVIRGLDVIVVAQATKGDELESMLHQLASSAPLGIGLTRARLDGAHRSLIDAEWAVDLAEALGRTVRFERDWLIALLFAQRGHLEPLLAPGVEVCRNQPHISDAALAFASNGFSQSEAARRLHLRPNSVGYRMHRWSALTGHDLLTPGGVTYASLSQICAMSPVP